MTSSLDMNRYFKDGLIAVGAAILLALALPLLAAVSLAGRFLLPLALVAVVLSALFVPAMRRWLLGEPGEVSVLHEGLRVPDGVLLSPAHAWARMTSRREATIGADDLVSTIVGPAEAVELPEPGTLVTRGQPLFTVRRGGRRVAVRAPLSGKVLAVNEALEDAPGLLEDSPYGAGWAVRIAPEAPRMAKTLLLSGRDARVFFRREVDRFIAALSPAQPVPTLQDGGPFVADLYARIDDETFRRLEADFLGGEER